MALTDDELSFLAHHGLSESDVLDLPGPVLPRSAAQRLGRERRVDFYVGTRCRKAGHRLRTLADHCIQCDSRRIAYQKRHRTPGSVYIAGSLSGRLIKVGGSEDTWERAYSLFNEGYAGFNDWELLYRVFVSEYGNIENKTHNLLSDFATSAVYSKQGHDQKAKEIFRCSFKTARAALHEAVEQEGLKVLNRYTNPTHTNYDFPTRD